MFSLSGYLFVSTAMFCLGLACIVFKKNLVHILMGIELVLNAAAINFAAFDRFFESTISQSGQVVSIFIIVLAAAEASVAIALLLCFVRQKQTIYIDSLNELKG